MKTLCATCRVAQTITKNILKRLILGVLEMKENTKPGRVAAGRLSPRKQALTLPEAQAPREQLRSRGKKHRFLLLRPAMQLLQLPVRV
jgi:hypothetical protein